jgi:ABC-2 type transport system ATP-binding protein
LFREESGALEEVSGMPVVRVEELARSFGEVEAVRGVSFEVESGEIFGFLGPNGAGKSTTIKMLCTLLRPTSGRAEVVGYDVQEAPGAVRSQIGLVFQESTLDEYLTAEQNLKYHAMIYHVPRREREDRIRAVLDLVGLGDRASDPVRSFSGGMRRRLEIARGLLHAPRVLFLDEPTVGLDPQTRRSIWEHVRSLRELHGTTIFMTTHYMDEAENADQVAIIDEGEIAAMGSPESLRQGIGDELITLSTGDNDAAVHELRDLCGIEAQTRNGNLSFSAADADATLPAVIKSLTVPVHSMDVRRPTLEDVFIQLTGRAIREEEADRKERLASHLRSRGRRRV